MTEGIHGFSSPRADVFPAGLRVLVVDDDPTWLKILEKMLKKCSYEVTTCGLAIEALDRLRERKDGFDIVISDVNMPDMDGFKLLEHVGLEMDLPVIMMSVDGETSRVMRGVQHGACDYLLKPIRMKELRNIWQHVYRKKIHEVRDTESYEGLEEILMMRNVSEQQSDDTYFLCGGDTTPGKKRKEVEHKYDEKEFGENSSTKKARVVWTVELHQKFVKAVNFIGFEKVGPKKILDLMNVPWLTRENVASHLQKYRLYLTRLQKDDLKTSSSGLKHQDFPLREEPIKIQQNEAINSYRANANTASLQTTEPKKILTGYAACFGPTQYPTFNPELPTQYSWNRGYTEIEFKQEPNSQFQVQNGFTNLGLPTQQLRNEQDKSANSSSSYTVISQNLMPSFQPPDPVIISNHHQSLQQTSLKNMELPAFLLQGQPCSSTNLDIECNNQDFIPEVPSNLYDALRFDYEFPPDSLEYPVIDQGLFIV